MCLFRNEENFCSCLSFSSFSTLLDISQILSDIVPVEREREREAQPRDFFCCSRYRRKPSVRPLNDRSRLTSKWPLDRERKVGQSWGLRKGGPLLLSVRSYYSNPSSIEARRGVFGEEEEGKETNDKKNCSNICNTPRSSNHERGGH